MSLATFIGIALIHLAAAMSPGPAFVVSVRTAASEGLVPAIALAFGIGLGSFIWALTAMLGLAVLFELAPTFLSAYKIAGGVILMYIAWQTWRHASNPLPLSLEGNIPPAPSMTSALRLGLITQLANPKSAVFFGAVFAGLVPPDTSPLILLALLVVVFLQETLWYIVVARLFSLTRARSAYQRSKRHIDRLFGGLIAFLGAKIALT